MLKLLNVSKRFGGVQILQDVSIEVPQDCIFGLIGPNGAGKTTVFNIATGLLQPTAGSVTFDGDPLVRQPAHRIARLGIARTFQNIRIFKDMTLVENVVVGMHRHLNYRTAELLLSLRRYRALESRARDRALELLSWVKLDHRSDELAGNLSYGALRKLEIARALATAPKLLLLDEPAAGMNSVEKADLMAEIAKIKSRGFTIFMIEHDMPFVMGLCERLVVLNFGRVIAAGHPDDIKRNSQVIEAYLGFDDDPKLCPAQAGL